MRDSGCHCVTPCAGKLSTAAARKSAAEVSVEALQHSENFASSPMMQSPFMLSSCYIDMT